MKDGRPRLRLIEGAAPAACCVDRFETSCDEASCMRLPQGQACGACVWVEPCEARRMTTRDATSCAFFPRKFVRDLCPPESAS